MKKNLFYMLLSLAGRDRHGLDIMRDVLELSDGELKLWPATLYGSLDELTELRWIEELTEPGERPEGESERRRYYRITAAGQDAVLQETARFEGLVRAARLRLGQAR